MLPVHRPATMSGDYADDKYTKRHNQTKFIGSRRRVLLVALFIVGAIYLYTHRTTNEIQGADDAAVPAYQPPPQATEAVVPPKKNDDAPLIDDEDPLAPEVLEEEEVEAQVAEAEAAAVAEAQERLAEQKTQLPTSEDAVDDAQVNAYRQRKVVEAFKHAWKGYATDCFGADEYQPLSHRGRDWAQGGIGLMITDSLDTMLLMNLTDEYEAAREWVATRLDFDKNQDVNVFETTIRVLGGLLSAYHLSGDAVFLDKATDLGNRLVGAFQTQSGIPYASVVLSTGLPFTFHVPSSTAEVTTVQLEFKYLSYLTGDRKYWDAAERVMLKMKELVDNGNTLDGLVPILISPTSGQFSTQEIRLGSRGDSYYEYLIKQYLQTSKTEPLYREMYDQTVRAIRQHLLARSYPSGLLYIAELLNGQPGSKHPKMDHLVCFIGGSFALGATEGLPESAVALTEAARQDLEMGRDITETCYEMYNMTATGLASEIVYFNTNAESPLDAPDMTIQMRDKHNLLRPETMESIFLLWRITGDNIYREWGWKIFEAFEKHCRLPEGGYTALRDVTQVPPVRDDRMDTFFLGETLKYLYLLFSPNDLVPLDKYVFNSEAHPLPIFRP